MAKSSHFAWENEQFREWWAKYGHLNPGTDPKTIGIYCNKVLNYTDESGHLQQITAEQLMRKKDLFRKPKITYLVDVISSFRDFFDPALNPELSMETIACGSQKHCGRTGRVIHINYINSEGQNDWVIPSTLVNRYQAGIPLNTPSNRCIRYGAKAVDTPGFREWCAYFAPFNPGLDPEVLYKNDQKTRINYRNLKGNIFSATVCSLCLNDLVTRLENYKSKLATNDPEFVCFYEEVKELNPRLELTALYVSDSVTKIRYWDKNGHIRESVISSLFGYHGVCNMGFHYPADYIKGEIRAYHSPCRHLRCKYNHPGFNARKEEYERAGGDIEKLCPYCNGKKATPETSIAAVDPEIVNFWGKNDVSPYEVPTRTWKKYNFVCPYCGNEFTKSIKFLLGKHPKCPACKDSGKIENTPWGEFPCEITFIYREPLTKGKKNHD